jgi:hypothetical protein
MGCELHITRRDDRWDEEGAEISRQERESVVAADPDLVMRPIPDGWPADASSSALMTTWSDREDGIEALHWDQDVGSWPTGSPRTRRCPMRSALRRPRPWRPSTPAGRGHRARAAVAALALTAYDCGAPRAAWRVRPPGGAEHDLRKGGPVRRRRWHSLPRARPRPVSLPCNLPPAVGDGRPGLRGQGDPTDRDPLPHVLGAGPGAPGRGGGDTP